jgi:hypothetical protein
VTPPEIVFALAEGQNAFFREIAEALIFELDRLGARGRIASGFPEQRQGTVTVLIPPHEFAALSRTRPTPAMMRRCLTISAEQPSSGFFEWNVDLVRTAGAALDINGRAVRSYAERGIAAEHLQLGYTEAWDRRAEFAERDIDVLLIGRTTPRRELALATYADVLERFNCVFILSDNSVPNPHATVNFASGEGKMRLLSRAKVLLNIHGEEEPYFEWQRVAETMSCGCALVTEHSTDFAPLRPGADFLAGRLESLGLLAAWLLDDEAARLEIVASADARMRECANMAAGAATLLAAAERVDREVPVDPMANADTTIANATITLGQPQPAPVEPEAPSEKQNLLRAMKRQHLEVLSLRRQLAADRLARTRPESPQAGTVRTAATSAWLEEVEPAVSVIVPLYNDGEVVLEALDSVRRSTLASWEIVVVDDASSDDGPRAVRDWMARHDSDPVSMVRHEVNRGLSAARNTGAEKSRARLMLMLDSDNLVRPYGLAKLVRALAADPGAAFAYGMLDRFNSDGPLGLVSSYDWEPRRLRDGNYIDALALIRRRHFTKLGGYSDDPRLLLGYEDYDFWARLAEAGERGAFVRSFVGSYRAGHSSMLSVTNISKLDAVAAVAEHAPTLMHGVRPPA